MLCPNCNLEFSQTRKRQKLIDYKLSHGCIRCGYSFCSGALDFHHVDNKTKKISLKQSSWSPSSKKVEEELKKCILLCKNCHYELHNGVPFDANGLERIR